MNHSKHIIRDIIVTLIAWSGIGFLYRVHMRRSGPLVRVLCFHDIADRAWFSSVLDLLAKRYSVVTPEQFEQREFVKNAINILITFDDGYASWVAHAAPELETRGMRGLFFVNSGLLDATDTASFYKEHMLISMKEPLTWEGAKELVAHGHTIGGHTVNHVRLSKLPIEDAQIEITKDKERLEEMLGVKLTHFAYPFGRKTDYTDAISSIVAEQGYRHQYTAVTGFAKVWESEQEPIPRTLIENNQSITSLRKWVTGSYDVFNFLKR